MGKPADLARRTVRVFVAATVGHARGPPITGKVGAGEEVGTWLHGTTSKASALVGLGPHLRAARSCFREVHGAGARDTQQAERDALAGSIAIQVMAGARLWTHGIV